MTIEEYRSRYGGMTPQKVREVILSNAELKHATEQIYEQAFGRRLNHSCPNCYEDAFIEIMLAKPELITKRMEREYVLKAGAILCDQYDHYKPYNRHTLTDEKAEYFLRINPDNATLFAKIPADWRERIADKPQKAAQQPEKPQVVKRTRTPRKSAKSNGNK